MEEQVQREPKACLVLLCGLPGAGKTSLAVALMKKKSIGHHHLAKNSSLASVDECPGVAACHLCYDDVIPRQLEMQMEGGESPYFNESTNQSSSVSPWKAYRQEILRCVDGILARLKSNKTLDATTVVDELQDISQCGREVWSKILTLIQDQINAKKEQNPRRTSSVVLFIDDNMYYRSMRHEYYQVAKKYSVGFCQVYLRCNTEVAVARNSQRRHGIPEETIRRMASRIEAPDRQVASWEKQSIHIDSEDSEKETTLSAIWDLITKALLDPVLPLEVVNAEEKEASRAACASSILHQADQSLRKCVTEAVTSAKDGGLLTRAELKALGSKVNNVRQAVLQKIRDGEVQPPPLAAMATDDTEQWRNFDAFIRDLFEKAQQTR
ncbi:L-seryl-tRNA(Sec) kinase-like [Patiria miniata]|uniref:L-seryl-tRNA(Sec) kinase n=1 Tax=Patiria miniata TaxID=46514 RepID=A0A914B5H0_PATMI|nr:L-seryl-tRNA(Sec) kinase-like [Patiria miniata]